MNRATGREAPQQGYIALLAILIIGAATTAIALVLLTTGTDTARARLITQQSIQARQLAGACAEEGLLQIHDNVAFTGTNSLTMGAGGCSYTVTNTGASTRTVTATGTVGTTVRKLAVYVTIGASSLSVTSWQEVT